MSNQINDKLDKILKLNEALQRQANESSACITQLSAKVESLQANIDRMKSEGLCRSSETLKVPRVLSAKVKALHASSEIQFDGEQQFNNVHNENVTTFLKEQLTDKYKDQFSMRIIHRAIYRYYESRRRRLLDAKPERKVQVLKNKLSTKKYLRKKRIYEAREKYLKQAEKRYWQDIPIEAMSTEEEGSEDDVFYRYSPSWRSDNLNKLLKKIDKRIEKKSKAPFNKKRRVAGALRHHNSPPAGLPKWMLRPSTEIQTPEIIDSIETVDVPEESVDLSLLSTPPSTSVTDVSYSSTPEDHVAVQSSQDAAAIPSRCQPHGASLSPEINNSNRTQLSSSDLTSTPSRRPIPQSQRAFRDLPSAGRRAAPLQPAEILKDLDADDSGDSSDSTFEL